MWNEKIQNAIEGSLTRIMLIAGLAIMVGLASPKMAQAQGPVTVTTQVSMVISSPCIAGESINLNGRMVVASYMRNTGATDRIIFKLEGTNMDLINPKKYVLNDENVTELNFAAATEFTQEFNHVLIRQGDADGDISFGGFGDDFKMKTKLHFTWNALGVPTATVDSITFSCM